MLRLFHAWWLILPAAALGGCPMYGDGCVSNEECDSGYSCDYPSGRCRPHPVPAGGTPRCQTDADCDDELVCDRYLRCMPPGGDGGASGEGNTAGDGGASEAGTPG